MDLLKAADCFAGVAAVVTEENPTYLSSKAFLLYKAMCEVARRVSEARGYVATVSVVHFHIPGEIVARACGMARSTMYLKLRELKACGLVAARGHYITHRGHTRADGMVWAVRLGGDASQGISVPHDYLKKSYRCLSADIEAGRTAWAELHSDSQKPPREQVDIKMLLTWALPPYTTKPPVIFRTVRPNLEAVLDVPYVDKTDRGRAVDGAAQALSVAFSDPGAVMFYRWLLWQLLRLSDGHRGDYWHAVYEQARRASTDSQEGFARRPGALFVSRLKQAPWWSEVRNVPPNRVASKPAN
jgi:hypothetical protein